MSQRARIPGLLLFVIATAFGLSSAFQGYLLGRVMHDPQIAHVVLWTLALNLLYWYIPALLAPVIMGFATSEQLGQKRWPIQVFVHVLGALTYSVAHTAVMMALRAKLLAQIGYPVDFPGWGDYTLIKYLEQLDWLLMTYLFLVGLAHALAYRREAEARALNAAQLETRLVEAQLQALQRQLHPHFLFNTLNTISGLIHTDAVAADTMIDQLGDLLRMTLHTSCRNTWRSNRPGSATACASACTSSRTRSTRKSPTCSCSPSLKTRSATASRRTRGMAGSRFTPTAPAGI